MISERPYFMSNSEWYYYDKQLGKLMLTNEAPYEAIKSYEEYYQQVEKIIDGVAITPSL